MRILLNIIWLLVSGLELAIAYAIAGLLAVVFIVTIPLAVPAFRLAGYALWPFGRAVVDRPDSGGGALLMNIVWFVVAGWWLVLAHLVVALLLAITIIGIPFAIAVFKMSKLALAPYGKDILDLHQARQSDAVVVQEPPKR
ncbi:MAG: YccF domain-containing protein [Nitriliruptorales bacterium]|nr:YccF domain-containing protein [Nitriliruptorales bacterium]